MSKTIPNAILVTMTLPVVMITVFTSMLSGVGVLIWGSIIASKWAILGGTILVLIGRSIYKLILSSISDSRGYPDDITSKSSAVINELIEAMKKSTQKYKVRTGGSTSRPRGVN